MSESYAYSTDIDYGRLFSLDQDGVIDYAYESFNGQDLSQKQFHMIGRSMLRACDAVGLNPDNEQLLFILSNVNRTLCESCAGSGKTTMSQMCVLRYKMIERIPSDQILCLAYNNNAVSDMINRHEELVYALNKQLKAAYMKAVQKGKAPSEWRNVMVDSKLRCKTIHAWAREWVTTYASRFKIRDLDKFLLMDEDAVLWIERIISEYIKRKNLSSKTYVPSDMASEVLRVYNFAKETLTLDDPESWAITMPENINGLKAEDLREIFRFYESLKTRRNKMDFVDLLYAFYELMTDATVVSRIRKNYSVLLLDEYQDTTPAMLRIVKAFAEGNQSKGIDRYDTLRLICVGDTDQAIYGYRGTDPLNCVRFKQDYKSAGVTDARILSMSVNRRCGQKILDVAREVIESNPERIKKPIKGIREAGLVNVLTYLSAADQSKHVINILRSIPNDEWGDTCICYRNNSSSRFLSIKLFEARIPFKNLKGGLNMFEDKVSRLYKDITLLFRFPSNKDKMISVFTKLFPLSRVLNKDAIEEIVNSMDDDDQFWKAPFEQYYNHIKNLQNIMNVLQNSYKLFRGGAMLSEFMPTLFRFFRAKDNIYFRNPSQQEMDYVQYMQDWYSQQISCGDLAKLTNDTYSLFDSEERVGRCVSLSSFHGLKGLEFKNVIIIDLDDSLFPGNELSRNSKLNPVQLNMIEREARRLFYVAVTRAKDNVWLLFSKENPCRYIRFFNTDVQSKRFAAVLSEQQEPGTVVQKGEFLVDDVDTLTMKPGNHLDLEFEKITGVIVEKPETNRPLIKNELSFDLPDISDLIGSGIEKDGIDGFKSVDISQTVALNHKKEQDLNAPQTTSNELQDIEQSCQRIVETGKAVELVEMDGQFTAENIQLLRKSPEAYTAVNALLNEFGKKMR